MRTIISLGDSLTQLKLLPSESVHCCVSSPPYWHLRDYGHANQIGLEPTVEEYIERLCRVFDEVWRVLRNDGTCWVNLGDTYFGSGKGAGATGPCMESFRFSEKPKEEGGNAKSLALIPNRFAIAMTDRGWLCRNEIIWHKPNPMPQRVKDRCSVDFEKMFFFVKQKHYYFDQQFEPVAPSTIARGKRGVSGNHKNTNGAPGQTIQGLSKPRPADPDREVSQFCNRRSVWSIPLTRCRKKRGGKHFAVFPEKLIETPILAGCPEGGVVLDPFCGSGTTAIVCERLNRSFLGIELNHEYVELSTNRIRQERKMRRSALIASNPEKTGPVVKTLDDQTPPETCIKIINSLPWAKGELVLEPFAGIGNFYHNLPPFVKKDWCEITEGRDFSEYNGPRPDTIITNPPFRNKARGDNMVITCLERCLKLAKKRVVFFVNDRGLSALTPVRLDRYEEWGWGYTIQVVHS